MKLTKKQQIYRLKKMLGSKSDLLDLDSFVDGRLTYEKRFFKTDCKGCQKRKDQRNVR